MGEFSDFDETVGDDKGIVEFLFAFRSAWEECKDDYHERRLNSEHTLQSALYFHLRRKLDSSYVLHTEMVVRLGGLDKNIKNKSVIDLVVSRRQEIDGPLEVVAAIEVKFTPRGCPIKSSIKKDFHSLSMVRNRRSSDDRVNLNVERFSGDETQVSICRRRKIIFAALIHPDFDERFDQYFQEAKQEVWGGRKLPNFIAAIAYSDRRIESKFQGAPIDRLKSLCCVGDN